MTQYLKGRALPAAVLSAAAAVVLLLAAKTCPAVFPTPETLSRMDPEAAESARELLFHSGALRTRQEELCAREIYEKIEELTGTNG